MSSCLACPTVPRASPADQPHPSGSSASCDAVPWPSDSLISYKDLVERPAELRESIESGFGNKEGTLGIVVIEGASPS